MEDRLRIRTPDGKAYEVDRWCPHAKSDLASRVRNEITSYYELFSGCLNKFLIPLFLNLKGVVLGSKLVCTKHNWTFSLDQGGKCTSADATINACLINDW